MLCNICRGECSYGQYLEFIKNSGKETIKSTDIATAYPDMYARMLHQLLARAGVLVKAGKGWSLHQDYVGKGLLCTKAGNTNGLDGNDLSSLSGHRWTRKGWSFIVQQLCEMGYMPTCVRRVTNGN